MPAGPSGYEVSVPTALGLAGAGVGVGVGLPLLLTRGTPGVLARIDPLLTPIGSGLAAGGLALAAADPGTRMTATGYAGVSGGLVGMATGMATAGAIRDLPTGPARMIRGAVGLALGAGSAIAAAVFAEQGS